MPVRIASKTTLRRALVLAVLLACVAGNSRSGSSQKNAGAPKQIATSITITGATRLYQPGDTSQLTMIATFADGTTRDVTAQAGWGYSGAVTISKSGLITALSYGMGEVFHNAYRWLEPLRIPVRVMPEGGLMVTVRVTEGGGFWLDGAQVSGSSAFGTVTAASSCYGTYVLAPVSGEVVVRVEKDGFVAQERQLTVERDEIVDFELQRISSADSIDGVYTLTFTAAPGCALSQEFRQRKYLARITEKAGPMPPFGDLGGRLPGAENDWLLVELEGPGIRRELLVRRRIHGQARGLECDSISSATRTPSSNTCSTMQLMDSVSWARTAATVGTWPTRAQPPA